MTSSAVLAVVGLALLLAGGELMVRGAAALAFRFGVSALAVGLTVVGFGTSAPELVVSMDAALRGANDVSVGNVVGSNICNLALILAISALIRPVRVEAKLVRVDGPLMVLVSLIVLGMLWDGAVSRVDGILLLTGFVAYVGLTFRQSRKESEEVKGVIAGAAPAALPKILPATLYVVAGLAVLVAGGHLLVQSAVSLAEGFGVSQAVIGLTIVALGTSLPELATSVVASLRGQGDIAVGNVVGSNIFNLLGILGVTATVRPLSLGDVGWDDLMVMVGVAVLALPLLSTRLKLSRVEGVVLLLVYAGYVAWLLVA